MTKNDLRNKIAKEVAILHQGFEEIAIHEHFSAFVYSDYIIIMLISGYLNLIYSELCFYQAKGNAILQASLERRKQALHERRLALEQDVWTGALLFQH